MTPLDNEKLSDANVAIRLEKRHVAQPASGLHRPHAHYTGDSTTGTRIYYYKAICAHGVRGTPYTIWSTRGVSACYTLDHGIISLCLSQKVKGQKRSAARETHIPLLCSDGGVVE